MAILYLDTFPTLNTPICAKTDDGRDIWVANRREAIALPNDIEGLCFAHVLCDPRQTSDIISSYRRLGFHGPVTLAAPNTDTVPHHDCTVLLPHQIQPVQIAHYGEATTALLKNGLTLSDDPALFLERPERISIQPETTESDIIRRINAFINLCDEATTLQTEGSALFLNTTRTNAWLTRLLASNLQWTAATFRGDDGPLALTHTLRAILRYQLCHPLHRDIHFELQDSNHPLVQTVQKTLHGKPVTGQRLQQVHSIWSKNYTDDPELESCGRLLDDVDRAMVFHHLPKQGSRDASPVASHARRLLGSPESWIGTYHRLLRQGAPRVCIIPTWQCELRCRYCTIVKQSGREMSEATALRSLDLLLSASDPELELHFFGGEPFLEWPLLQTITHEGHARALAQGRAMRFQFTTNGFSLTEAHLDALAPYDCHFQLSLDGAADTQRAIRKTWKSGDSYAQSPAAMADWFRDRNLSHDVICVVHPTNVDQMVDNLCHIWDLGYRRIQLNYAIGAHWDEAATASWTAGLQQLKQALQKRWQAGQDITLTNLSESRRAVRANLHLTVDWDGAVYGSNGFLYLEKERERFRLGHLDEAKSYTRYMADGLTDADLFAGWTWKGSLENNQRIGAILNHFSKDMA